MHTSKQSEEIKVTMSEFQEQIQKCLMVVALTCTLLGIYHDLWLLSKELQGSLSGKACPLTPDLSRAVTTCVSPL